MPFATHREMVDLTVDDGVVEGMLALPANPIGVVLFAHGSGSGRNSPRNNKVAERLRQAGLGTLLMDLLTESEDRVTATRFDINLLTERLALAADWLSVHRLAGAVPLCLFGASTGAAAALRLAAARPEQVAAVVSRGGRPDLAEPAALGAVHSPTLLIVGSLDVEVLRLNEWALAQIPGDKELLVVPGATHLFEEPGTLDAVAEAAANWFTRCLSPPA
jgi:putative phosphoribosyl transferase